MLVWYCRGGAASITRTALLTGAMCRYLSHYLEPNSWHGKSVLELGSGTGKNNDRIRGTDERCRASWSVRSCTGSVSHIDGLAGTV